MARPAPIDFVLDPMVDRSGSVPAARPNETGFLENLNATRDEMLIAGNTDARSNSRRSAYAELLDALGGEDLGEQTVYTGQKVRTSFQNPEDLPDVESGAYGLAVPSSAGMKQSIFARIRERRAADPSFLAGVADNQEAFEHEVDMRDAPKLQRIRGVQGGATRAGSVGGFVGGVIGSFQDPVNLWTMPFGGGAKTFLGAIGRAALENMAIEAVSQPAVRQNYADLGEDLSLGDSVRNILFAGGAGAAFRGVHIGIGRAAGAVGPARDAFIVKLFEAMPAGVRERWTKAATVDDGLLTDFLKDAVPPERWTAEQRDALNVVEREHEVRSASPFMATPEGDEGPAMGLAASLQRLIDADRPPPLSRASLASGTALGSVPRVAPALREGVIPMTPDQVIRFVINDLEGGAHVVRYGAADGGTTKFGIAAKFNQGVDVAGLTEAQAAAIAKRDYWFEGLDLAPPATAAVAFDAGFIGGPKVGKAILAASGGDAERAIALYRAHLNRIADTVEGKAKYRAGWNNRVDKLARKLGLAGDGRAAALEGLDGHGVARGSGESAAELAELEALSLAREGEGARAPLRAAGEDPPLYEPVPVLKRELFGSDDDWLEAQASLYRAAEEPAQISPQGAADAPPAREAASDAGNPPDKLGAGAEDSPGAIDVKSYVDAYLAGEGRGDSPRDLELQQFAANEAPAIEAEFRQRVASAPFNAEPLTIAELEALRPDYLRAGAKRDPLWLLAHGNAMDREQGREPHAVWALRDKRTGEIATWTVKKGATIKELDRQWEPEEFELERVAPENADVEIRARAAREAAASDVRLDDPALEKFDDPAGEGAQLQTESLEHDLKMDAAEQLQADQLIARNRAAPRTTGLKGKAARPIASFVQDPAQVRAKGQRKRSYYKPVVEHADHASAKAGNLAAARRLVRDLAAPETLEQAARELQGATFVPVIAEERSGRNAIPLVLAKAYAKAAGGRVETKIVQSVRAFHTNASPAERVVRRAGFDGPVVPGERYVLVDDISTLGGTIAELAEHIQRRGGTVERVVLLASGTDALAPTAKQIRSIEEDGYAEALREFSGIEPAALTRGEAQWILDRRSPGAFRDQLAEAVGGRKPGRARDNGPGRNEGENGAQAGGVAEERAPFGDADQYPNLTDDGRTIGEVLDELDAEDAAIEALRGCLK